MKPPDSFQPQILDIEKRWSLCSGCLLPLEVYSTDRPTCKAKSGRQGYVDSKAPFTAVHETSLCKSQRRRKFFAILIRYLIRSIPYLFQSHDSNPLPMRLPTPASQVLHVSTSTTHFRLARSCQSFPTSAMYRISVQRGNYPSFSCPRLPLVTLIRMLVQFGAMMSSQREDDVGNHSEQHKDPPECCLLSLA